MAQIFAHLGYQAVNTLDIVRMVIVAGCAAALIAAGRVVPLLV